MSRSSWLRAVGMSALLLSGVACRHTVRVASDPDGALVLLPDGREAVTPFDIRARRPPVPAREAARRGGATMTVQAPGYRAVEIRVGRAVDKGKYEILPADPAVDRRREVRLLLVEQHGPAGTWTEAQLP